MRRPAGPWLLLVLGGAAVLAALLLTARESGGQTPQSAKVLMQDFAFRPAEVTVTLGANVIWEYRDMQCDALFLTPLICPGHNSRSVATDTATGQPLWRTGDPIKGQGKQVTVTMSSVGRFPYYCEPHQGPPANMRGVVNVVTATTASTTTTTTQPIPPPPMTTFYFAEGTVRPGFAEFITLQNVREEDAPTHLTFQASDDGGGAIALSPYSVSLLPRSRLTVNVNDLVAAQGITAPVNVSVQVTSEKKILAERPLYFNTGLAGGVDGGSDVIGARAPSTIWNFAEGTVRPGFQEYLTFQNTLTAAATAAVTFQASDDSGRAVNVPPLTLAMPAGGRVTKDVNRHLLDNSVPLPVNLGARVTASAPVVVERPLYFNTGLAGGARGGTTVIGTAEGSTAFYFAEGTVRPGFSEFITLQNATPSETVSRLSFQAANDGGTSVSMAAVTVTLPASSRRTVNVAEVAAMQGITEPIDVSVQVSSDVPILAERPLYFRSGLVGGVDGGSDVIGATRLSSVWNFAEGTVREGFQEYLTFQNPLTATANVTVTFQASDDDGNPVEVPSLQFSIGGQTRATKDITRHVADAGVTGPINLSARVVTSPAGGIVVERPLYFYTGLAGGAAGGTAVVGSTE